MDIIVCIKPVPYISGLVEFREDKKGIIESRSAFKINDTDDNALEEALRLKDRFGGKVTVITVSSSENEENARQVLWECIAKGADQAIHLVDEIFADVDPFTTAKLLEEVIRNISFDLILTGSQASDDNLGHVGPMLAELLGLPYATLIVKMDVDLNNRKVLAWMEQDEGFKEVIELKLPALLTIQSGINEPRYASLSKIRMAQTKPINKINARDVCVSHELIYSWRKIRILELSLAERKETEFLRGDNEEIASKLAQLIVNMIRR
jgi:electron transfer flavoprotein beta subunit